MRGIVIALGAIFLASYALACTMCTSVPFTLPGTDVVHYISPTGSDSNNGTSPSTPWLTPNHAMNCGDVIIAAAGSYTTQFQSSKWGTVSNCPSTSGGIDGTGGVYFATVLCGGSDITKCAVNGGSAEAFRVDQSHWAVEGFTTTDNSGGAGCMVATSESSTNLAYVAFINNIASGCGVQGFASYSWHSAGTGGVDYTAVVGAIAYNAAQSVGTGNCGSGISLIPTQFDTNSGTHIFVAGYFGYKNINAPTGAGCNTDGEGLIFDSWACQGGYSSQGVVEQSVMWANGSAGLEVFPNCSPNTDNPKVYVTGITSYGNNQDPKHSGQVGDLWLNNVRPQTTSPATVYSVTNSIFEATEATSGGNGTSNVYGCAVYVSNSVTSPVSVAGNYCFQSNPGSSTTVGVPNTDVWVNGTQNTTTFPFGTNTYSSPGFSAPGSLPSSAPNCAGYTNTTSCMNAGYNVATDLTPSGGAVGLGYQAPGPCKADTYYPTWLKGVVYLLASGSAIRENLGLITQPCGT